MSLLRKGPAATPQDPLSLLRKCLIASADTLRSGKTASTVDVKIEDSVLLIVVDSEDQMDGYKIPLKQIDRVYNPSFSTILGCKSGKCITRVSHMKSFGKPRVDSADSWMGPGCGTGEDSIDQQKAVHEALTRLVESTK